MAWDGRNRAGQQAGAGTHIYHLTVQREDGGEATVLTKKLTVLK